MGETCITYLCLYLNLAKLSQGKHMSVFNFGLLLENITLDSFVFWDTGRQLCPRYGLFQNF